LNAWIKDYAARNGLVYLGYYSAMLDDRQMLKKELTNDGLHPNDAGYELIEPLLLHPIQQAGGALPHQLLAQLAADALVLARQTLREILNGFGAVGR
jgi:GDSL-like Lipase/Acylhydrolase family